MRKTKTENKSTSHPNKVLPGDILFCNHSKHPILIHCTMYIGNDFYIEALPLYGVRKLHKNMRPWIWDEYEFGYVKKLYQMDEDKREDIIHEAIRWAKRRRWCRYQWWNIINRANYNPWDFSDFTSSVWY
jgi:cell wall-associated NlpC family hydrolase